MKHGPDNKLVAIDEQKDALIADYFKECFAAAEGQKDPQPRRSHVHHGTFNESHVEDAIKACNFAKGMGPDNFWGGLVKDGDPLGEVK